jgi:hypothetical protein
LPVILPALTAGTIVIAELLSSAFHLKEIPALRIGKDSNLMRLKKIFVEYASQ